MARNQHAVIWTRLSGEPEKMGDLLLSAQQVSFTYTEEYLSSGQAGFCLLGDASIWGADTVVYPVSERIPVFPRMLSLIPGANPRNLQRRHYLDLLKARLGKEPPPGPETEWRLLMMGGHGGIGHIDVFPDDISAVQWYRARASLYDDPGAAKRSGKRSQLWRMLKREVLDENLDFDAQQIERVLGPTPSVGGMISKLLLSVTPAGKTPVFYAPGVSNKKSVVLKVEPPEYKGMLDLEALCLDIHAESGFDVPWHKRLDDEDLHFLAVERFDQTAEGLPVPMESLFSVIATGDHKFRETGDLFLQELGGKLDRLSQVANLAPDTNEQMYRRILMALLTGNGDLHLDNISLLGGVADCRLSPIYDPAPMRAWPRHNLVSAIPYDPEGYADRGALFVDLGGSFGLSDRQTRESIHEALAATSSYAERVAALNRVPERQRQQLIEIVRQERLLLEKHTK